MNYINMASQKKLLALGAVITGGVAGYVYIKMGSGDDKDGSEVANETEEIIPPSKWKTVNEPMLVGRKSSKDIDNVPDPSKKEDAVESVNKEDAAETLLRDYLNAVDTEESLEDGKIN